MKSSLTLFPFHSADSFSSFLTHLRLSWTDSVGEGAIKSHNKELQENYTHMVLE